MDAQNESMCLVTRMLPLCALRIETMKSFEFCYLCRVKDEDDDVD